MQANPDYKGVCHIALAQEGHCRPGEVLLGTNSHACNAGAFGQFATGIGNTDAGLVMGTGKLLLKVPPSLRFILDGEMSDYLLAKDLILQAAYVAVMQCVTISNRHGYDSLLKIYRETDQSQEKVRILGSLASCPNPEVVLEILNFLLTPEVRNQDAVDGVRVGWEGRDIAWTWLKENWEYISKFEDAWGSGSLLTGIIGSIVSPFCSEEEAKEVEEFFASRTKPSIARTLKQSLEKVRNNAIWLQSIRNDHSLEEVLKELLPKTY